jgi:hypothetical protein
MFCLIRILLLYFESYLLAGNEKIVVDTNTVHNILLSLNEVRTKKNLFGKNNKFRMDFTSS